jgi:UDP-2-acetamido-2-deoxy-ribo-hexuluronate aminotransferase
MELNLPIQMYDPKREYREHKEDIQKSINNVLDHGIFINGPEVKEIETTLSSYTGVKHAIAVSNGTDALTISLLALGIKPGNEVITVAHTWISSAETIALIGAIPKFVDINSDTFNMDPLCLEKAITENTKAIIVVSLYGLIADMDIINIIAKKHNLPVIEDGAQSFGAKYNDNKSCSLTTIGTTSFFPSKPLGCYGDGGAIFTNDDILAEKIRAIKSHGGIKRFEHKYIGINGRLDTLQAAILNVKIKYFDTTIEKRNNCANYYSLHLKVIENHGFILPKIPEGRTSVWAQYSILAPSKDERDKIVSTLKENNVNVAIFYPTPLHTQECFLNLDNFIKSDLPVTDNICDRVFNLPCYAEVLKEEQDYIIKTIHHFIEK